MILTKRIPLGIMFLAGLLTLSVCEGQASANVAVTRGVGQTRCIPTAPAIERLIVRYGQGRKARRRVTARILAPRILREARRFRLDPIALLAVASVESDFRSWIRGRVRPGSRRSAEVGVWQLIPGDSPVRRARRALDRACTRGPRSACPARVWGAKRRRGRLTVRQLANLVIGTWVVAHEIRQHLRACRRRHPRGHSVPLGQPRWLARWAHYNSGPRAPTRWYRFKLARQYRRFRRVLCARPVRVAVRGRR